jgi:hypothetical protein
MSTERHSPSFRIIYIRGTKISNASFRPLAVAREPKPDIPLPGQNAVVADSVRIVHFSPPISVIPPVR